VSGVTCQDHTATTELGRASLVNAIWVEMVNPVLVRRRRSRQQTFEALGQALTDFGL
jgi:hypothetical protein